MSVTQTVEIPANRRLTIDVPREIPVGRAELIFIPIDGINVGETTVSAEEALACARGILAQHLPAFEALAQ